MKKLFIISLLIIGMYACTNSTKTEQPISKIDSMDGLNVNDVWVYEGTSNPFEPKILDTMRILNLKDGYVQYEHMINGHCDTNSCAISTFKFRSHKL